MNKRLILFFDCGDTMIDESTEYRAKGSPDKSLVVIRGDTIPGTKETIKTLYESRYRMAVVADGLVESFNNLLGQNHLAQYFETFIYSETINCPKPNPRMFKAAIGAMDLSENDIYRIAMVGNNLERDIKGANQLGITSIHIDWTPRYPKEPKDASEKPDYVIHTPEELIALAEKLNDMIEKKEAMGGAGFESKEISLP